MHDPPSSAHNPLTMFSLRRHHPPSPARTHLAMFSLRRAPPPSSARTHPHCGLITLCMIIPPCWHVPLFTVFSLCHHHPSSPACTHPRRILVTLRTVLPSSVLTPPSPCSHYAMYHTPPLLACTPLTVLVTLYIPPLIDGFGTTKTSNISSVPSDSNVDTSTPSTSKLRETSSDQQKLIDLFKISSALRDYGIVNIRLNYAKWLFIENIIKQLPSLVSGGKWKGKLPGIYVIAPIFMSVPAYYRWKGVFVRLHLYPQMELWLQGKEGISDYEVWRGKSQTQDMLKAILNKIEKRKKAAKKDAEEDSEDEEISDNLKSKDKGKGKGKERAREQTKGKEKEKEKWKDGKRKKNRDL
ncbi:hypothetical protein BDQ17DRAFT_1437700 [Cyathus striatus]|nr:hypothetical protein BDQ17DRAFT_1437700 [Cyathus striatus]